MKFFFGILLVALVALAHAEEAKKELNPENVAPVSEQATSGRNKRGFVYSAYTAPVAAAAVPVTTYAAAAAPVAYAGYPYAYSAYSAYAPYYSGYPAAAVVY